MKKLGKSGFGFIASRVEAFFLVSLVAGFILGKTVADSSFSYILMAAAGVIAGRLSYTHRENDPLPFIASSAAFAIGFLMSHRAGEGILLALDFIAAGFATNRLHRLLSLRA